MSVDEAGNRVLRFVSAAQNLTQIGELTNEVTDIAQSGEWRRYKTGLGVDKWLECEFDYFLIACNLSWDDVSRVVAWTKAGADIAPLMDRDVPAAKRRPLELAAKAWHAASTETLVERANRLGWTKGDSGELRIAPLPPRVRARHAYGVTMDEHAKKTRADRLDRDRRDALDALVDGIEGQLADDLERLYVIDRLRRKGPGRARTSSEDIARWQADMEDGLSTKQLAERWGVTERQAKRRMHHVETARSSPAS
jgi:hypothetical protein